MNLTGSCIYKANDQPSCGNVELAKTHLQRKPDSGGSASGRWEVKKFSCK